MYLKGIKRERICQKVEMINVNVIKVTKKVKYFDFAGVS